MIVMAVKFLQAARDRDFHFYYLLIEKRKIIPETRWYSFWTSSPQNGSAETAPGSHHLPVREQRVVQRAVHGRAPGHVPRVVEWRPRPTAAVLGPRS